MVILERGMLKPDKCAHTLNNFPLSVPCDGLGTDLQSRFLASVNPIQLQYPINML